MLLIYSFCMMLTTYQSVLGDETEPIMSTPSAQAVRSVLLLLLVDDT